MIGAERDRIVDEAGVQEMATFLDTDYVMLPTVPHEVSDSCSVSPPATLSIAASIGTVVLTASFSVLFRADNVFRNVRRTRYSSPPSRCCV